MNSTNSPKLVCTVADIREALSTALRQWRFYAEERPDEDLATATHAEGEIYQHAARVLASLPADGVVVSREDAEFAAAWERVKAGAAAHGTWAISLMTNNEETWTADVESLRTDGPTWMATEDTDLAALTALAEKLEADDGR